MNVIKLTFPVAKFAAVSWSSNALSAPLFSTYCIEHIPKIYYQSSSMNGDLSREIKMNVWNKVKLGHDKIPFSCLKQTL